MGLVGWWVGVGPEDVMSMMMFEDDNRGSMSVVDLDLVTWRLFEVLLGLCNVLNVC